MLRRIWGGNGPAGMCTACSAKSGFADMLCRIVEHSSYELLVLFLVIAARPVLVQEAFRLEYVTLAWMLVEAVVSIGSGVAARSTTLLAAGIDSLIELASAALLIWRQTPRRLCRDRRGMEPVDARGTRVLVAWIGGQSRVAADHVGIVAPQAASCERAR